MQEKVDAFGVQLPGYGLDKALCPKMRAALSINELDVDAQPIAQR